MTRVNRDEAKYFYKERAQLNPSQYNEFAAVRELSSSITSTIESLLYALPLHKHMYILVIYLPGFFLHHVLHSLWQIIK